MPLMGGAQIDLALEWSAKDYIGRYISFVYYLLSCITICKHGLGMKLVHFTKYIAVNRFQGITYSANADKKQVCLCVTDSLPPYRYTGLKAKIF